MPGARGSSLPNQGANLAAQARGLDGYSTVVVEYARAKKALYQLLLLGKSPESLALANQIEQRMNWISHRQFFAGLSFFELDPFIDGQQNQTWNVR